MAQFFGTEDIKKLTKTSQTTAEWEAGSNLRIGGQAYNVNPALTLKTNTDGDDTTKSIGILDTLRGDPDNALGGTDLFGRSVAINGDYIVVGAYYDDGSGNSTTDSGAAYVYKIDQSNDSISLLDTLRGDPDPNNALGSGDNFGISVAISGDYIVVGAYLDDGDSNSIGNSGAAYVYKIDQGDQDDNVDYLATLRGDPNNALGSNDRFGYSVAINGDYIVVGAYLDDGDSDSTTDSGAAYVYKIDQSNDSISLLATLRGDPNNPLDGQDPNPNSAVDFGDYFGYSVAISGDYIVVGAYLDDGDSNSIGDSGAAYVFSFSQIQLQPNTMYYVYAVVVAGVVSLKYSLSDTAPTGYSAYRRIGVFKTDGNAEILAVPKQDNGSVGDVIHSMLTEEQFIEENGAGWVLADGRDVTGSKYATVTGNTTVPDMRGQFLRGKNNGRSASEGNPSGEVNLGTPQTDDANSLTEVRYASGETASSKTLNDNGAWTSTIRTGDGTGYGLGFRKKGTETRPKNITVNIFIKIEDIAV